MSKEDKQTVANAFVSLLEDTIVEDYINDYNGNLTAYRPSAISGCSRKVYYDFVISNFDTPSSSSLIGILETGTFRHEVLQNYIKGMRDKYCIEWVTVEDYLRKTKNKDVEVIEVMGNETRCYYPKYNISFSVDGILKIKDEYYLLEIKTETFFKYRNHQEPHTKHTVQANTYCLCLGINNVIFLYENRDTCTKKAYYYESTKSKQTKIIEKIKTIEIGRAHV